MGNHPRAIAVTGLGAVSPLGPDVEALLAGLKQARSGLAPLSLFEIGFEKAPVVGEIREALPVVAPRGYRLSRTDQLGVLAAREALAQAAVWDTERQAAGVVAATTVAGLSEIDPGIMADPARYFRRGGFSRVTAYPVAHLSEVIAASLGLGGPRIGLSVACASGAMAVVVAARMIIDGAAPLMLAVGSDALCRFTLAGFNALQALDSGPCRPFDRHRSGLNIGEGAAALALESVAHARQRQARVRAILKGWAMTNDAFHPTAPDEEGRGLAECLAGAIEAAGVSPDEISYINAHGTGTPLNDVAEARAYQTAFGRCAKPVPVSSSKSYFGHTMAAAGALEAVVTILSLTTGTLFPTLRLSEPIECPAVDWLMGAPRPAPLQPALSVSAGFGGSNASLVFERAEGENAA